MVDRKTVFIDKVRGCGSKRTAIYAANVVVRVKAYMNKKVTARAALQASFL